MTFAATFVAISVAAGVRCYDVGAVDGGCLTQQPVAVVFKYGEIHGGFLANYFPHGAGLVFGAYWGGDVGTPLYRFADDRVRFAVRFQLDGGLVYHEVTRSKHYDFQAATYLVGPQLWLRLSPRAFFTARTAVGGTTFLFDSSGYSVGTSLTVDATLGFAFDL
jgi:hypothetical protein